MLASLMQKLWKHYQTGFIKEKNKALGGFDMEDPLRKLPATESIYSLAFIINLNDEAMDHVECGDRMGIPQTSRPTAMSRAEINLTAVFCGFCQMFTSYLLF